MSVGRRSARLRALCHDARPTVFDPPQALNYAQDNSEDDCSSSQSKPSRKKRKVPAVSQVSTAKQKRAGKLSSLPEMPIDILFEIFGHLLPLDLLRLSRATKLFRRTLMNRSSILVWKQARANVPGLPDCPSELSEPEYANLVFDTHCHICAAQGAVHVLWGLFKRVCKSCLEEEFSTCYGPEVLEDLCNELGIASDRALTDITCLLPISTGYFQKTALEPVLLEYASIESEAGQLEWRLTKTGDKLKRLYFANLADEWYRKSKQQRQNEIKDLKNRRSAAILDRMKDEGWADVVERLNWRDKSEFGRHKVVKQNKDLTDRIWKNIKPKIIPLFQTFRDRQHHRRTVRILERRQNIFSKTYAEHCASLPPDSPMAPIDKLVPMDVVRDIMYSEDWDSAPDESLFQNAFAQALELSAQWKANLDKHLYQLFGASPANDFDPSTLSTFHFATSLFCCRACTECHLTYQQVLSHRCHDWVLPTPHLRFAEPLLATFLHMPTGFVMVMEDIQLCPHRERMKKLLDLCNLPEDTTMAAVQDMNPLVECTDMVCLRDAIGMDWHAMYWHELLSHDNLRPDTGMRLLRHTDLAESALPPLPGVVRPTRRLGNVHGVYGCKYCYTPYPLEFSALQEHLTKRHNITIESRLSMEHYHIHPATATNRITYGVLYGRLIKPSSPPS